MKKEKESYWFSITLKPCEGFYHHVRIELKNIWINFYPLPIHHPLCCHMSLNDQIH